MWKYLLLYLKKFSVYLLVLVLTLLRSSNSFLISYFSPCFSFLYAFLFLYVFIIFPVRLPLFQVLIYIRITAFLVGSVPLIFPSCLCICSLVWENLFWIDTWQNSMQCSKCGSCIDLYSCLMTFSILFSIPYLIISDFFLPFWLYIALNFCLQRISDYQISFVCCLDPILCVYS